MTCSLSSLGVSPFFPPAAGDGLGLPLAAAAAAAADASAWILRRLGVLDSLLIAFKAAFKDGGSSEGSVKAAIFEPCLDRCESSCAEGRCGICSKRGGSKPARRKTKRGFFDCSELISSALDDVDALGRDEAEEEEGMRDRSTRRRVISSTLKSEGLRKTTTGLFVRICLYCCIRNCFLKGSSRLLGALPLPLLFLDGVVAAASSEEADFSG